MDEPSGSVYTIIMFLLRWFTNALLVILVTYVVPGIAVESFWTALLVALVLGILNAIVRPILVILTLPITLLTLGLFTLVINGALFWLVSTVVKGFNVDGFWAAFLGAAVLWVFSFITNAVFKTAKR
jgi:putative membrane protein